MKAARTRALNKKHAGTGKHHHTAKHTGTATRHAAKAHKQTAHRSAAVVKAAHLRAWSPDEEFAVCSARAVAESLRLALGVRLADEDVLGLHWAAGGDPDAGASISDVLDVSSALGALEVDELDASEPCVLASVRQHAREPNAFGIGELDGLDDVAVALLDRHEPLSAAWLNGDGSHVRGRDAALILVHGRSLILGLDLPWGEPHAVAVDPDGAWWSWGEPYAPADFPGAVIEEAWAVTWS